MARQSAGEDFGRSWSRAVDTDPVLRIDAAHPQPSVPRRVPGPPHLGRRSCGASHPDVPSWNREVQGLADRDRTVKAFDNGWRLQPQMSPREAESPATAEGDRSRVTVFDHFAKQCRLAAGDSLESDAGCLRVQPSCPERRWHCVNRNYRNAALRIPWIDPSCSHAQLACDEFFVCSQGPGQMYEVLADRWADRFEPRQQVQPYPVAQELEVGIRAVEPPRDVSLVEPGADLFAGPWQERSNDATGGRRLDPGEGTGAAAAQELNQHPLRDVVAVVAGGNGVEVVSLLEAEQSAITETTPCPFAARGQRCPSFDSQEMEWNPEIGTEGLAE